MEKIILESRKKSKNKKRICMFHNCKKQAIKSHVLQKNGILKEISVNNHLIQLVPPNPFQIHEKGMFDFKSIGINNVYTFPGFCSNHDTSLFKPIESNKNLEFNDKNQQALFCYRGLCQEIRRKEISIEWMDDLKNHMPPPISILSDSLVAGYKIGIKNLSYFKSKLENAIITDNYSSFRFETVEIPKIDLCISVVLNIKNSNKDFDKETTPFETSFINIFPKKDKSMIICGYHKDYPCKWTIDFLERIKNASTTEIVKELSDLITLRLEFWTMSPKLFNQIDKDDLEKYKNIFTENIFNHDSALITDLNIFRNIKPSA